MTLWYNQSMIKPLANLRKQKKLTLQEVADALTKAGIYSKATTSHVSRIEARGTQHYPTLKVLADTYECSVEEISALQNI